MPFDLSSPEIFAKWTRVHDAVRNGIMPPGTPAPNAAAFVRELSAPMAAAERARTASSGRAVLRRLNRYEYESTVRELLGAPWLQLKDSLPEDGIVARFNKSGQALDISHVQMARYMETAENALRAVLANGKAPRGGKRHYARDQRAFINRMRYSSFNNHPERATIPVLGFTAQPGVIAETEPISNPARKDEEAFVTPASTYTGNNYHFDGFTAPAGGIYTLRFHAYSMWIGTVWGPLNSKTRKPYWHPDRTKTEKGRTVEPLSMYALRRGGEKRFLGTFDVNPEPGVYELEVALLAGEQIQPDAARLFRSRPGFIGAPEASKEGTPGVAFRWMEVEGPAPARGFPMDLRTFMTAAYRRAPTQAEFDRFDAIRRRGQDPTEGLIAAYTAVLCSPAFLYFDEPVGRLDDRALASRLSYFLWNGPPDARLRERPLEQVDRLLDDKRAENFVQAFLDYWLDLRKIGDTTPDQTLYPDYYLDDLLTESAQRETQMFFAELIRKNLPVSTLIDSDFTFLNAHLARHYGIAGVDGSAMRRVTLPAASARGGLLTQASVLKITANGTTTSPVLRGAWIMERILGDPAPPPPPNVPAVEPDTRGATTIRQQLDKHRSTPSCAGCHAKIDPPGFALESFDVFGAWRERYRSTDEGEPVKGIGKNGHEFTFRLGLPVDASGELGKGQAFRNVAEFKRLLKQDERKVARNLVQQLIVYSTGVPVQFSEREEVERILTASARSGYGVRTLIHQVVRSPLFTRK